MAITKVNPHIFRAYDIRGIATPTEHYPIADLTPETVKLIALGTGTYLKQKYQTRNMMVGMDNRLTSPALQQAFIEGIRETGIDVVNIGLSTSPLLHYAVVKYNFNTGANITASHNPKAYNGIKIVQNHDEEHSFGADDLQEVLKIVQSGNFIKSETLGNLSEKNDVFADYLKEVCSITKLKRPLKIVVDAGNGVAGKFAPELLRGIGCEVTELYCELDGNFPNHEANPEEAHNMVDLGKKVVELKADLGIGLDGDGDRVGVVDENGKHYSAEYLIMLLARDYLKTVANGKVIFDVKVSQNLINDIKQNGGQPIMSKTGHTFIKERIKKENASLAGENSGHIFFGKEYYYFYSFDDGMFAACKIIEVLSKSSLKFSEHFKDLPKLYSTPELKIPCPDNRKFEIVREITSYFTSKYDCITLDGVRVNFDEQSWAAIRCSNTTPNLTLRFEAGTLEKLEEIKEMMFKELAKYPEVDLSSIQKP